MNTAYNESTLQSLNFWSEMFSDFTCDCVPFQMCPCFYLALTNGKTVVNGHLRNTVPVDIYLKKLECFKVPGSIYELAMLFEAASPTLIISLTLYFLSIFIRISWECFPAFPVAGTCSVPGRHVWGYSIGWWAVSNISVELGSDGFGLRLFIDAKHSIWWKAKLSIYQAIIRT